MRRASLYVFGMHEYPLVVPISRLDDGALRYAPSDLLLLYLHDNPFCQRGQTRLHAPGLIDKPKTKPTETLAAGN